MPQRISRFRYGVLVVWPGLWLAILQNLVGILLLGYYVPSWDIHYMCWASKAFVWKRK
jgi:hypothetical protein